MAQCNGTVVNYSRYTAPVSCTKPVAPGEEFCASHGGTPLTPGHLVEFITAHYVETGKGMTVAQVARALDWSASSIRLRLTGLGGAAPAGLQCYTPHSGGNIYTPTRDALRLRLRDAALLSPRGRELLDDVVSFYKAKARDMAGRHFRMDKRTGEMMQRDAAELTDALRRAGLLP